MSTMTGRRPALALVSTFILGACHAAPAARSGEVVETLPYYNNPSFTPTWFASTEEVPTDFHAIGEFSLVDQTGTAIGEETFSDAIYIANFFFTACPGICPMTMANMNRLQAAFAENDNVFLLSHSVTPDADSVAALQAFAERMAVLNSKWFLATGDRETLYRLGKEEYFADEDLGESREGSRVGEAFLHTESFFLIDQNRRIRGVYNGMNRTSVDQLMSDVETLLAEGTA